MLPVRLFITPSVVPVTLSDSPTNDLGLALSAIASAQKNLLINAYELQCTEIVDAIQERISAGVDVRILEEGQPVGGDSCMNEQEARDQLVSAMKKADANDQFFLMTHEDSSQRRFHFDHAKYMVIDGEYLLIGSENYSETGHPSAGKKGNRGWEVLIDDADTARSFEKLFVSDSNPSFGDIQQFLRFAKKTFQLSSNLMTLPITAKYIPKHPESGHSTGVTGTMADAQRVEIITSPDNSLSGLLDLLNGAKESIDLELMTFTPNWGGPGKRSPLYNAVVEAARRGVEVRVLLNDEGAFDHTGFNTREAQK